MFTTKFKPFRIKYKAYYCFYIILLTFKGSIFMHTWIDPPYNLCTQSFSVCIMYCLTIFLVRYGQMSVTPDRKLITDQCMHTTEVQLGGFIGIILQEEKWLKDNQKPPQYRWWLWELKILSKLYHLQTSQQVRRVSFLGCSSGHCFFQAFWLVFVF